MPIEPPTTSNPQIPPTCSIAHDETENGTFRLICSGDWLLRFGVPSAESLQLPDGLKTLCVDDSSLSSWDGSLLAFLYALHNRLQQQHATLSIEGLPDGLKRLMRLALAVPTKDNDRQPSEKLSLFTKGRHAVTAVIQTIHDIQSFVGELTISLFRFFAGRSQVRWNSIWEQIAKASYQALPLISLIGFLIGIILAFIGSIPLKMFGAEIFVASLVGIGILRLMAPVMVGIVMAGRTGAAFAAELGSMNVNDEIDAFRAMGVSPMDFLVLPRVIALCVMMPLLCIYADLLGILGGMLVGLFYSNLSQIEFARQLSSTTSLNDLFVGIVSCSIFGVLTALCGCYQGIRCGRNSVAVGQSATAAVVNSIICMTISTAVITVLTVILKI